MRIRTAVLAGLAALAPLQAVAACSSGEPGARPPAASPRSPSPSAISPVASATPEPPGTVRCDTRVGGERAPSGDLRIVGDAVALPAGDTRERALQVSEVRLPDGGPGLFAKQGLLVRRGRHVELTVPEGMTGRLWLKWGRPDPPGTRVVVDRCDSDDEWIAFVGGYTVREAGCLPVLVGVDGGAPREVLIGIGAPCPGQRPAPRP
ncbi:hypothetical protein ACLQ2R_03960 [Streptosporangium sp. DT93]|uniref:hypothetical protein n=1 Tax=Streptosporangium sp. DT93 TaxID=3393428 RepID=UPI003CEBBF8B